MKKLEGVVSFAIFCLCIYLVYGMYQPQIHGWLRYVKHEAAELTEEIDFTEGKGIQTESSGDGTGELPVSYDGRAAGRAPEVKNQGDLGTCWAVAASSALEASLLPGEHQIFSADHLSMQNGYDKNQEDGGAYTMAMAYLAAWKGPVPESEDPYGDGQSPDNLNPVKHVQEIRMYKDQDFDGIRRAVLSYGAVQASLYMDMQGGSASSLYYSDKNHSYCYTGREEANHDVLIIGWDDGYPAENFIAKPKANGAFICQNSWGTSFGDDGVFYVSYEDTVIGKNGVAYSKVEQTDNYDSIYQSDLCGWVGQLGYESEVCYFANVYQAKEDEEVKAVGFYAVGPDTSYEIGITENFESSASLMGEELEQKGDLDEPGYYTIELEEPIAVKKGQKFAAIAKIRTPGTDYPVATEYRADENTDSVDISDGEGYISMTGYNWSRAEEAYQCNLCLKVYTAKR